MKQYLQSILIAEDDKMLLKTVAYFLAKNGYQVTTADEGGAAAEAIRSKKFDLIITDLNMPYANGLEIVHLVRNELRHDTPVIVLTSVGLERTQLNAFNIGANEFITKPFSLPVLVTRIKKLLLNITR